VDISFHVMTLSFLLEPLGLALATWALDSEIMVASWALLGRAMPLAKPRPRLLVLRFLAGGLCPEMVKALGMMGAGDLRAQSRQPRHCVCLEQLRSTANLRMKTSWKEGACKAKYCDGWQRWFVRDKQQPEAQSERARRAALVAAQRVGADVTKHADGHAFGRIWTAYAHVHAQTKHPDRDRVRETLDNERCEKSAMQY
jgi:hypothetical protein